MRSACAKKRLPLFLPITLLLFKICLAQDAPFQGEVNADNINVRADSTVSSLIICSVHKGQEVDVVSQFYEWYKIRLPKTASIYIKKNMVECIGECENAKVLKDKVNVRSSSNESSVILGSADKNQIVKILRDKGEWYRIEPIENSFGWINKSFVNRIAVQEKAPVTQITGIIRPYGKVIKRAATHKLSSEDNKTFLLKADKKTLDALNYHKVKVSGTIISSPKQKYPIIEVEILEALN